MKILHLIQKKQLRGAEVFTSQLASHTNRLGNKAIIVSLYPGDAELPFEDEILLLDGRPKHRFWDLRAWSKLAGIIKTEKPDIVQANAGDTLKYAVFSKLLFGWKQPILFRNASTISLYIKSGFAQKLNGFFFQFASKVISVSKASAADFARLFPQFKNRIITIPIGIEHAGFDQPAEAVIKNDITRENHSAPKLIHVGGFSFEKNHEGLIRIFELILQNSPAATLHLVGDGPLKKKVEDIVQEKGLSGRVSFYGFKKNALQFIRSADVLLLPSLIEGLPGVILEAFYCRTPVVAYNVGGIQEIVADTITGRLIPENDEQAFALAVIEQMNNGKINSIQVDNAYRLVISQYLNTHIAKRFINLYQSVVSTALPVVHAD